MTSRKALLLSAQSPMQGAFLELFFDSAFIFALLELSHTLTRNLNWSGAFQDLIMLMALWRVWLVTIWITDRLDPQRAPLQLLVVAALLGSLILATATPRAFGREGLVFAVTYTTVQSGRYVFLLVILRHHRARGVVVRALWSSGISAAPWLAGAFTHGVARGGLWTFAVVVEYAVWALSIPLPWTGQAGPWEPPASAEHLAERYRQFFIIALGELILASGLAFRANDTFGSPAMAAFVVAIISSALVWRIYICRAGEDLSSAFEVASTPARLGIAPAWVHLGMVAGIVVTSAGFQVFIAHPLGPGQLAWAVAMLAGPALFLACRTCFEYVVYARLFWSWPAGALALGILILPALFLPPLATAVTAAVVLAVIAIIDTAFYGRHRASRTPPQAPAAGTQ